MEKSRNGLKEQVTICCLGSMRDFSTSQPTAASLEMTKYGVCQYDKALVDRTTNSKRLLRLCSCGNCLAGFDGYGRLGLGDDFCQSL